MAFPSSAGANPFTLDDAFKRVREVAGRIKTLSTTIRTSSAAGPITATSVIRYCEALAALKAQLASLAATPNLGAYAQQQYPGLNLAAEYSTMAAQIDVTVAWVVANFPKAPGGQALEGALDASGNFVPATFTTAALATFRTQIDALIATID